MNEHPLVRSVGIVLRARDPRNARMFLASLDQWLSEPRSGSPMPFDCWMCRRDSNDVGVFTHVIEEENGNLSWEIGGRSSSARVAMCDVCVAGCRASVDPTGEESILGHILAALKRSDEEAQSRAISAAYARPRLWSVRGYGICVTCRQAHASRVGTENVALCGTCLGRFQLAPLRVR